MEIDIIIPAYNPGTYINEAIESCLKQSYKNFKITVVDDCSSQNLSYLKTKYPKINFYKTIKNSGPAAARNLGIQKTSAELIAFLDADDLMHQDRLFYTVEEFKKHPRIGMVCGNYQIFVNRTKLKPPFYKKSPSITWETLMRTNLVASGSTTVKRKVLTDVGLFNEKFWIAEDADLWLRISEKYSINYIPKVLYYYSWINKKNSSLTHRDDIQQQHLNNLKIIKEDSLKRMKQADNEIITKQS